MPNASESSLGVRRRPRRRRVRIPTDAIDTSTSVDGTVTFVHDPFVRRGSLNRAAYKRRKFNEFASVMVALRRIEIDAFAKTMAIQDALPQRVAREDHVVRGYLGINAQYAESDLKGEALQMYKYLRNRNRIYAEVWRYQSVEFYFNNKHIGLLAVEVRAIYATFVITDLRQYFPSATFSV